MIPQNLGQQPPNEAPVSPGSPNTALARVRTRALSYLRVSGKGQIGGDGFPRQRTGIAAFAEANALDVVEEFRDEGVSGTLGLAERPGLTALLEAATAAGIDTVLVEKADRLARDLVESELLLRIFRDHGIRVIEAEAGTDLTNGSDDGNPTGVLIRQVLAAVAQFEKSGLVAKLRAARDRVRRQRGRCEGPPVYGARGAEAAGLKRLLELAIDPDGKPRSLAKIAAALNAEQVPTRTGRPWARSTVQTLLARQRATSRSHAVTGRLTP
ncbi:MAG: recombinase family protein [Planctomycetes bacterium]|nr:recombinase family protein [Planctomycetota bacterium]